MAAVLEQSHHPFGEIANVDELYGIIPTPRREHLASCHQPLGPVGEAIRCVAWTDDVCRTYDQRSIAERFLYFSLASRLRYAVGLGEILRILDVQVRRKRL